MPLNVTFEPFDKFPRADEVKRIRAPFTAGYADTLHMLEKELRHLDANSAVIQLNVEAKEIRRDGMPRTGASPKHPGVIFSFQSKFGPLKYISDKCARWEDNLRGIAKTLEWLRLAERYGVAARGEQYTGWAALPPPNPDTFNNRADAMAWLFEFMDYTSEEMPSKIALTAMINGAIKKAHPDHGGSSSDLAKSLSVRKLIGE